MQGGREEDVRTASDNFPRNQIFSYLEASMIIKFPLDNTINMVNDTAYRFDN